MSDIEKARDALRVAEGRMTSRGDTESAIAWVNIANGWLRAAAIGATPATPGGDS